MAENSNEQPKKTDWSRVDSRIRSRESSGPDSVANALARREPSELAVPGGINVPAPDLDAPRGILAQWKRNAIDRKTALQAIQSQYDAQLEALRYQLQRAVNVSNARADRIAEEFLKKLDSEHIQILKDLGLKNAETRASALIEVRDMIAQKLREVQSKEWPEHLLDRTIDDILDLEKRVSAEMMKELGA